MNENSYSLQELLSLRVEALFLLRAIAKQQPHLGEDVFLLRRLTQEQKVLAKSLATDELSKRLLSHFIALLGVGSRLYLRLEDEAVKRHLSPQLLSLTENLVRLHGYVAQHS